MRFLVQNFGCRATQADGAALDAQLTARGWSEAGDRSEADVVILNTCTVTANADEDARAAVRRVQRENPAAKILVTGCYAQRAPEELARMPGVDWVVGNSHKTQIADLVSGNLDSTLDYHGQVLRGDIFATNDILTAPILEATGDRTRPNLKIQDGCHNRCSFCVIPYVRGKSRYVAAADVVAQVRSLASRYKEVVLSGINLGRWGRSVGSELRLAGLLRRLLDETGIECIRLSSVEPMDFNDELLELMAGSTRIARHVHAPLQSGSDWVLRKMHRKYRPQHYADRIARAHALMPDSAIGADVMVGFPGETEERFRESLTFIEALPFTYLHVFTYSERPGTPAASMPNAVPVHVRKERNRILRDVSTRKNLAFRENFVGRELPAVTMDPPGTALSSNFLKLKLNLPYTPNRRVRVRPTATSGDALRADVLGECAISPR